MKTRTIFVALLALATSFTSCKKDNADESDLPLETNQNGAVAITPVSSVLGTLNGTTTSQDSIYAMDACRRTHERTKVEQSTLLPVITTYLNANYDGFTFVKAFSTTLIASDIIDSYVVGFIYNSKPVALRFNAAGAFVKVLELREGKDLNQPGGYRPDGFFENRDGMQRDSIVIDSCPLRIKQYFATYFAKDTLKSAWLGHEGGILVISKNVKYYGTAFRFDGVFIKREILPSHPGMGKEITQTVLPNNASFYLGTTFPNYMFNKAFEHKDGDILKGYLVIIDANLTKYAVLFNATGALVEVKTVK